MKRRTDMRIRFAALFLAGLVLSLAIAVHAGEKKYTIATVGKIDGIAWFDRMREGAVKFGADTGHTTFMQSPAQADAAQQVQIIESLIAQKVDAICVVPFSPEALEPVLKRAMDAGILVIAHESSGQKNADLILEAFKNKEYGAQMMRILAEKMGGEGEFANFVGSLTSKSHNEWMDGAEELAAKEFPKLKLVSRRSEDYDDQNRAYERSKELLTTYPNLKGILGSASTTAPGAALAVEERGLEGKVFVVGTSLPSAVRDFVKSGSCSSIAFWDPALAAYAMNAIAVRMLNGEKIADGADIKVEGYNKLSQDSANPKLFYGSAWVFIDKSNVDEYNF